MADKITISITLDLGSLLGGQTFSSGSTLPIQISVSPGGEGGVAVQPAAAGASLTAAPRPNVDSTTAAVITAAVTAALAGRPFRIQNIQLAPTAQFVPGSTSWAQAGRQTIHASHAIERKFR